MTITRANAEAELVSRASKKMVLVGMAVTTAGSNASLQSPLSTALRKMDLTASSPVTDVDLSALDDDQIDEFYDRAELRLLENILGNIDLTDIRVGERQESLGQLATQLEKAIDAKTKKLEKEYGAGVGSIETGVISLNFQQKGEDYDDD